MHGVDGLQVVVVVIRAVRVAAFAPCVISQPFRHDLAAGGDHRDVATTVVHHIDIIVG